MRKFLKKSWSLFTSNILFVVLVVIWVLTTIAARFDITFTLLIIMEILAFKLADLWQKAEKKLIDVETKLYFSESKMTFLKSSRDLKDKIIKRQRIKESELVNEVAGLKEQIKKLVEEKEALLKHKANAI